MSLADKFYIALTSTDIELKQDFIDSYLKILRDGKDIEINYKIKEIDKPSYSPFCTIVNPKDLTTRKDFSSKEGLGSLVHAITHIEYSAIDLALDAVYRFADMPIEYKIDWLVVADDEIRHFYMLNEILTELGFKYGDFHVHCGLFDASVHTRDDILDRMAIIPRYYEASGLDVNPQIIKKLHNKRKEPMISRVIDSLNIIYDEEITHVKKGDIWFKYICNQRGLDVQKIYMNTLKRYRLDTKHRPHINVQARKEAGFSCDEIIKLGAKSCD